jgi:hypothetical protein
VGCSLDIESRSIDEAMGSGHCFALVLKGLRSLMFSQRHCSRVHLNISASFVVRLGKDHDDPEGPPVFKNLRKICAEHDQRKSTSVRQVRNSDLSRVSINASWRASSGHWEQEALDVREVSN